MLMNGTARLASGALAVLLLAGTSRAAAPGGIIVDITPARQSLTCSDDVVVTVTIRNTSNATRYLLKWQTPLTGVQAPLFDVTRDGLPVSYPGIQAKRPPPTAADVIALEPGAITGAYSVRYRADRLQVHGRPDASRTQGSAAATDTAAAVWIDGRLPRGMPETAYEPAAGTIPAGSGLAFIHCSNAQQESIAGAVQAGLAMTQDAGVYLQGQAAAGALAGSDPARAVDNADSHEYFGENNPCRTIRPAR
jgi:peptidyl-Lys metalloendopeptidase